ncbi:MAG: phosphoribosylformylglycinamidine cyclo-ligase [candidate division KSB1 bacterium]|nr:phosphoribosylformylglycinamidine cyclo-ligase [candidate division KSB1 bacterium]
MKLNYKIAGVDIDAADAAVKKIAELSKQTHRDGVLGGIGHFGAFFSLDVSRYKNPVLVSSVDGVGTKIKIACALGQYRGIGRDLVNHCVNDVMCSGAEPLYFLDYLALGKLDGKAVLELATGLVEACKENGCALIGGETAEMPDIYQPGEFDIAGTLVGVVERDAIIDGSRIVTGDVLLGLPSTGLHTNGYTLARRIIELSQDSGYHKYYDELGCTIGEALLAEHRSYYPIVRALKDHPGLHGIAHITGGGILGNTRRILPDGLDIDVDWDSWQWPAIFTLLQQLGDVEIDEMRRVFNLGVGLVLVVAEEQAAEIVRILERLGEKTLTVGRVVEETSEPKAG